MLKGRIFDIKEFSINDGPGVRTTVFMKGCPLRCAWCHNPEGISPIPQENLQTKQMVGKDWTSDELIHRLNKYRDFFEQFGGGVTFSGGEPSMQADFLIECIKKLKPMHVVLDTSGYCESNKFIELSKWIDLYYFDLKIADSIQHQFFTGVSNKLIINNLENISKKNKKIVIRIPMIPHITDTQSNLDGISKIIFDTCDKTNVEIHLLPYNSLAGGKYPIYNMKFPLEKEYKKNEIHSIKKFDNLMRANGYIVTNYVYGEDENE